MTLVALAIAVGSFTIMSFNLSEANYADSWHEFTPGTATPNPLNPAQYTSIGSTPPTDCEDGPSVCAIKTPEGQALDEDYLQDLQDNGQMSGPEANENVRFKF
ncbi:MAG: hypothetical protein ACRDE7_01220 [Sphingobacterium sp.]